MTCRYPLAFRSARTSAQVRATFASSIECRPPICRGACPALFSSSWIGLDQLECRRVFSTNSVRALFTIDQFARAADILCCRYGVSFPSASNSGSPSASELPGLSRSMQVTSSCARRQPPDLLPTPTKKGCRPTFNGTVKLRHRPSRQNRFFCGSTPNSGYTKVLAGFTVFGEHDRVLEH